MPLRAEPTGGEDAWRLAPDRVQRWTSHQLVCRQCRRCPVRQRVHVQLLHWFWNWFGLSLVCAGEVEWCSLRYSVFIFGFALCAAGPGLWHFRMQESIQWVSASSFWFVHQNKNRIRDVGASPPTCLWLCEITLQFWVFDYKTTMVDPI